MNKERFFEATCQVEVTTEDKKGNEKVKRVNERYLVPANTIADAEQIMNDKAKSLYCGSDYRITSVKESKIMAVIEQGE
jgi:hypothetical protein